MVTSCRVCVCRGLRVGTVAGTLHSGTVEFTPSCPGQAMCPLSAWLSPFLKRGPQHWSAFCFLALLEPWTDIATNWGVLQQLESITWWDFTQLPASSFGGDLDLPAPRVPGSLHSSHPVPSENQASEDTFMPQSHSVNSHLIQPLPPKRSPSASCIRPTALHNATPSPHVQAWLFGVPLPRKICTISLRKYHLNRSSYLKQ